jgi:integrase
LIHGTPNAAHTSGIRTFFAFGFGFHNLRHSLASFLVRSGTDIKTEQTTLRHANVKTTLQIYAHSLPGDRMTAQGNALDAIFHQQPAPEQVN